MICSLTLLIEFQFLYGSIRIHGCRAESRHGCRGFNSYMVRLELLKKQELQLDIFFQFQFLYGSIRIHSEEYYN